MWEVRGRYGGGHKGTTGHEVAGRSEAENWSIELLPPNCPQPAMCLALCLKKASVERTPPPPPKMPSWKTVQEAAAI